MRRAQGAARPVSYASHPTPGPVAPPAPRKKKRGTGLFSATASSSSSAGGGPYNLRQSRNLTQLFDESDRAGDDDAEGKSRDSKRLRSTQSGGRSSRSDTSPSLPLSPSLSLPKSSSKPKASGPKTGSKASSKSNVGSGEGAAAAGAAPGGGDGGGGGAKKGGFGPASPPDPEDQHRVQEMISGLERLHPESGGPLTRAGWNLATALRHLAGTCCPFLCFFI